MGPHDQSGSVRAPAVPVPGALLSLRYAWLGLVCALAVTCAVGDPAHASDPSDSLDRELAKVLDRWSDPLWNDRLAEALRLGRQLLNRQDESIASISTKLLAVRLELASGETACAASHAAAMKESPSATREQKATAIALELLAVSEDVGKSIATARPDERAPLNERAKARLTGLEKELYGLVSPEAGSDAIRLERRRVSDLKQLPGLGRAASPLKLKDAHETTVDLAQLRGKVVLIEFFDATCKASLAELPALKLLFERNRARGFALVRVALDRNKENPPDATAAWHECLATEAEAVALRSTWTLRALPQRFLVDSLGKVRYLDPWGDELAPAVQETLARRQ